MDAILRTPRLVLEPLRDDDLPALHAHWTEPGVRRFLWDGEVVPPERVRDAIAESARLFREDGAGLWAVRPRGSPGLIGCAGFWYFHEPPERELVLSLSSSVWGRGLGRECAGALLDHAFGALGWPEVQGSADRPNAASLRLMRRLGMRPCGERPGAFGATDSFRIDREEWLRRALPAPSPSSG